MSSNQVKHIPKDAQVIMSILKELGITDYEPRVINQLLEFTYRYVTCILDDAKVYANHSKKKMIDLDDVKLASQLLLNKAFTTPPSRDILLELSRTKNNTPLPLIKPHCGLRLPADRYCLSSCNYKLRGAQQLVKNKKRPSDSFANRTNVKARQPQKDKVNINTIRNMGGNITKTQNVTIPKPLFKFSTTSKTLQVKKEPLDIKIEPMDEESVTIKRKREEDDFEIV